MDNTGGPNEKQKSSLHEQMELIFHEQYAQNYNKISSYSVSLIIALIGVFAGFGYCVKNFIYEYPSGNAYLLLNLAYIASLFVLGVIAYLCSQYGWSVRRDQFIIYRQRVEYYRSTLDDDSAEHDKKPLFPSTYKPFDKKGVSILVGTFAYIYKIVIVTSILIFICMIFIYAYSMGGDMDGSSGSAAMTDCCRCCLRVTILLTATGIYAFLLYYFIKNIEIKYQDLTSQFIGWQKAGAYLH